MRAVWKPKEHQTAFERRLSEVLKSAGQDSDRRLALAEQFVELTRRALSLYEANRTARGAFRALNWVLPSVSAIAAAVGGSVLTAGQLSGVTRWIVGGVALIGGIAGGLVSVVKPADELASHQRWVHLYEAIWREAWQYAINELPGVPIDDAVKRLDDLRRQLAAVEGGRTL